MNADIFASKAFHWPKPLAIALVLLLDIAGLLALVVAINSSVKAFESQNCEPWVRVT